MQALTHPAPSHRANGAVTGGETAITVQNLQKHYGPVAAVHDLSFSVARGEIFALLGPNGAGKTTTIEILEGYRNRDGGTVRVLGEDPQTSRALKQRIGIMLQQSAVYPNLQVFEALQLFCSYYRDPADPRALLALIGLEDKAHTRFKHLSGGQKQRLSLGLALAGKPDLVFLDEPTASMDTQARLVTWDVINGLRTRGVAMVLTTHYLEEAQRIADRVAIIDHGRLVALGTPAQLTAHAGAGTVHFRTRAPIGLAALEALPGALQAREEGAGAYSMSGEDPHELLIEVALWSRASGNAVTHLHVEQASLEDVFLTLTGEHFVEGDA
jgi:ABC-2 type transport system ATP-binding protein